MQNTNFIKTTPIFDIGEFVIREEHDDDVVNYFEYYLRTYRLITQPVINIFYARFRKILKKRDMIFIIGKILLNAVMALILQLLAKIIIK